MALTTIPLGPQSLQLPAGSPLVLFSPGAGSKTKDVTGALVTASGSGGGGGGGGGGGSSPTITVMVIT